MFRLSRAENACEKLIDVCRALTQPAGIRSGFEVDYWKMIVCVKLLRQRTHVQFNPVADSQHHPHVYRYLRVCVS